MKLDKDKNQNDHDHDNKIDKNRKKSEIYRKQAQSIEHKLKIKQQQNKKYLHKQEQISIVPQIRTDSILEAKKQKQSDKEQKIINNLLLNTLFFDSRQKKPQFYIKLFSLFTEDITQPKKTISKGVQSIFITASTFEFEALQHLLNVTKGTKTKVVLLLDSQQLGKNKIIRQHNGYKNFTIILKSKRNGQVYKGFRTKLWLIKFTCFLRVVICTGDQNMMDWTVWQNIYWYQDFPHKALYVYQQKQQPTKFNMNKDFQQTLREVLQSIISEEQLEQLTKIKIDCYIFYEVNIVLIPSIPGWYSEQEINRFGIGKIKQLMKIFNNIDEPIITYNSPNPATLQRNYIRQFYLSFCPKKEKFYNKDFKLIYPTQKYIQQETGGQASVLLLTQNKYNQSNMGKNLFYQFQTNPQNKIIGCIPHFSTLLIESSNKNTDRGILYLGTHNLDKGAWGKIEKNGSRLYIQSYQLGVLFLDADINWFRRWCPFKYPPDPYGNNDEPFFLLLKQKIK